MIGEDVSKRLDVVPAQYQMIVTHRPKYACRSCEGPIDQAAAPARLIEGGLLTERLVTQVVVGKCGDHVPLYRQAQGFARQGISLDRFTLAFRLRGGRAEAVVGELLARIGQLYPVEAEIRGQSAEARRQVRRQRSGPLIAALKSWLEEQLTRLPGRPQTAEAIRYIQTHWDGLTLFLDDGRIELDTNPAERTMRPIALNRKNALFAGSDEGAEHWAILATLIECCKLHGVNPAAYLEDVLTRLVNGHLNSRLDDLTPVELEGRSGRRLTVKPSTDGRKIPLTADSR